MNSLNRRKNPITEGDLEISEEDLLTSYSLKNVPSFPKNGSFKDSYEYYQTLFKLFRANFLFPLSDQLINAIEDKDSILYNNKARHPKSAGCFPTCDEEDQAEQNEYLTFDVYDTFEVLKKSKNFENISVKVQRKVSEFAQISGIDKLKIKYNDLVLLFDTKTKAIFKGIVSFVNQEECDEVEDNSRTNQWKSNQAPKQILVEQIAKIQFENKEIFSLENFSTLRLIRSRQYWFSIASCFKALKNASKIGSIAFSDQTLNGKPATNFPNYSKIDQKQYQEAIPTEIAKLKYLNQAQQAAILHAMTTESALIQGPPGTGKSFVAFEIRKLLFKLYSQKSKKPIFFITKKNITLDEQIELDFKAGHKVIRMGNQYSKKVEKIAFERLFEEYETNELMKEQEEADITDSNSTCASEINEEEIYTNILTDQQIRKAKLESKRKQNEKPSGNIQQNPFPAFEDQQKLQKVRVLQDGQTQQTDSSGKQTPAASEKADSETGFTLPNRLTQRQKDVNNGVNFLNRFQIIGMTFSGSHLNYEIIEELKPEIIIIEEASEVIETELAPLLGPWVKHIIQIGDFKQLRPFISYQKLSVQKNYEISYFERLIPKLNAPSVALTDQRRMHPNLSIYSRQFYRQFSDDESVKKLYHFKDFDPSGAYFFNHTYPEKIRRVGEVINEFEARFLEKVVNNILTKKCKNDKGEDISITVLTMYNAQFEFISKLLWDKIHEKGSRLKVSTVDSFQGQESDVILLSCVRSNPMKSNRFLIEENRINVAMSRARLGFLVIGNLIMLRNKSKHWDTIIQKAYKKKSFFSEKEKIPSRFIKYGNDIPYQLNNKTNTICPICKSNAHLGKC